MTHSRVDLIDYIGKLLSSNDDVTKTHDRVVVELQQVVSEKYHDVDYDYRSDIHITYEKREVSDGKRQYAYLPTIVRYDGGSIQAFDDTPKTRDFVDWFNEGYKKAMCLYFPWFEKLKLRDLDIEGIHALCGNDEADADIYRQYGLAINIDPSSVYDHGFVFKYDHEHEYASGTVMIERSRLNVDGICRALSGRADEFDLKPSYVIGLGGIEDNFIGDMAKQLMVNGTYNLLASVLYPAANQPNSNTVAIEVKLQHVVAEGMEPKYYRLSYSGHLLSKTTDPYVADLKDITKNINVDVKYVDVLPLRPIFSGWGDDLRIDHYQEDVLAYRLSIENADVVLTPHMHDAPPEGHNHGTTAPE